MGALGSLLATLFGSMFGFLGKYFVGEKAFRIAGIAIMLGLVVALYAAFKSCATGICSASIINVASEYPTFAMGLGIAFNTTTYAAVSAFMTVWTGCQLYILKKRMFSVLES